MSATKQEVEIDLTYDPPSDPWNLQYRWRATATYEATHKNNYSYSYGGGYSDPSHTVYGRGWTRAHAKHRCLYKLRELARKDKQEHKRDSKKASKDKKMKVTVKV